MINLMHLDGLYEFGSIEPNPKKLLKKCKYFNQTESY